MEYRYWYIRQKQTGDVMAVQRTGTEQADTVHFGWCASTVSRPCVSIPFDTEEVTRTEFETMLAMGTPVMFTYPDHGSGYRNVMDPPHPLDIERLTK